MNNGLELRARDTLTGISYVNKYLVAGFTTRYFHFYFASVINGFLKVLVFESLWLCGRIGRTITQQLSCGQGLRIVVGGGGCGSSWRFSRIRWVSRSSPWTLRLRCSWTTEENEGRATTIGLSRGGGQGESGCVVSRMVPSTDGGWNIAVGGVGATEKRCPDCGTPHGAGGTRTMGLPVEDRGMVLLVDRKVLVQS